MDSGWGAVSCAHHDAMRDDSSHMGERDRYGVRFLLSHFVVFFGAHGQARLVLIPSLRIIFKYIPRTCLSYVVFFFFHDTCVFSNYIFPFILPAGPDPSIVSGYHTMASF